MTHLAPTTWPPAACEGAARFEPPEYLLVFGDDEPPKEHEFVAISDEAAAELMRKQYPRFAWSLYHVHGGLRDCVYRHPGPPAAPAAVQAVDGPSSPPADHGAPPRDVAGVGVGGAGQ